MFNHVEGKHPVARMKTVPRECSTQKQTTLKTFATACPAQANRITTLFAEFVARDLHPISTVDGKGFQQLLHFLEPDHPGHISLLHVGGFTAPWRNSCWKL